MDLKEFKIQQTKANVSRQKRIRNSWGNYDIYKYIRKHDWYDIGRPLKEHEFYSIIRGVNDLIADDLALGKTVTFPSRMGRLELRKFQTGVSIVDGKLKVTYPINWSETLRLWYEDEEAKKNKTLLRNESDFIYHIKYCKHDANYENKTFYEFSLNRFIKRALKDNIVKGKIDSLW